MEYLGEKEMNNLLYFIVLIDALTIGYNCYLFYKVTTEQNKLSEYNVTGRACEFLRLGILIPLNYMVATLNIFYILILWGLR